MAMKKQSRSSVAKKRSGRPQLQRTGTASVRGLPDTEDPYAHLPQIEDLRDPPMAIGDHIEVLRKKLILSILIILLLSITAGFFSVRIHSFLTDPFLSMKVTVPNPANLAETIAVQPTLILGNVYGPLEVMIKLAVMVGLTVGFPILILILWSFITPAISRKMAWVGNFTVAISALLFWSGLIFCWFYVFPISLSFMFNDFLPLGTVPTLTIEKYYGFLFAIHIALGLLFQFPLLMVILGVIGIFPFVWHKNVWRYMILGIFVLSAVLTPPDPISQLLFALPLLILYFVSLAFLWVYELGRK